MVKAVVIFYLLLHKNVLLKTGLLQYHFNIIIFPISLCKRLKYFHYILRTWIVRKYSLTILY